MRYDEFRDLLKSALREAGLSTAHASFESETVELANSNRHWESYVQHATLQEPEPFHVSAKIAFHKEPRRYGQSVHLRGGSSRRHAR